MPRGRCTVYATVLAALWINGCLAASETEGSGALAGLKQGRAGLGQTWGYLADQELGSADSEASQFSSSSGIVPIYFQTSSVGPSLEEALSSSIYLGPDGLGGVGGGDSDIVFVESDTEGQDSVPGDSSAPDSDIYQLDTETNEVAGGEEAGGEEEGEVAEEVGGESVIVEEQKEEEEEEADQESGTDEESDNDTGNEIMDITPTETETESDTASAGEENAVPNGVRHGPAEGDGSDPATTVERGNELGGHRGRADGLGEGAAAGTRAGGGEGKGKGKGEEEAGASSDGGPASEVIAVIMFGGAVGVGALLSFLLLSLSKIGKTICRNKADVP